MRHLLTIGVIWLLGLQPVGAEQDPFDRVMAGVEQALGEGEIKELHSLLVYSGGALRYEAYFKGNDDRLDFEGGVKRVSGGSVAWHADRPHYVASVTKTITALLAGIAMNELGLTPETPVAELLANGLRDDANGLTLGHLLSMRSGFLWDEWTDDDLVELWQSKDFSEYLLARENVGPGTVWRYNSAVPNLLLTLLEGKLDRPFADWAQARFFGPLGIVIYRWDRQPTGTPEGAARLYLTPRDMLKIGQMMLDGGLHKGQQIVPKGWVAEMAKPRSDVDGGGYGYMLWLRTLAGKQAMVAEGDGGQYIWIFPGDSLVVVITQGNYLEWPLYCDQAEKLLTQFIFPALAKP